MTEWEKLANRNDDLERELAETKAKLETAETKSDALQDVAWVSGATFGWNCAEAGNPKRLHDAICARQREYLPALATIRAGKDEEVMKADLQNRAIELGEALGHSERAREENERLRKQVEEYESKKLLMDQFEIINTIRADERRKTVESVIESIWDMEPYPARSDVIKHIRREFIEGK